MTATQIIAVVAAVAVLGWPLIKQAPAIVASLLKRPAAVRPSYQAAMSHLAEVRHRLVATEQLADDQKKAIDVLTLALVDGSDL